MGVLSFGVSEPRYAPEKAKKRRRECMESSFLYGFFVIK